MSTKSKRTFQRNKKSQVQKNGIGKSVKLAR